MQVSNFRTHEFWHMGKRRGLDSGENGTRCLRWNAECAVVQFNIAAGSALDPIWQFCDYDLLGGMHKFLGPLLGTLIFVVAQDYLSSVTGNWMTFIGLIFVLIVLLFPNGLLGMFGRRVRLA